LVIRPSASDPATPDANPTTLFSNDRPPLRALDPDFEAAGDALNAVETAKHATAMPAVAIAAKRAVALCLLAGRRRQDTDSFRRFIAPRPCSS
jgi:hypothetical protein